MIDDTFATREAPTESIPPHDCLALVVIWAAPELRDRDLLGQVLLFPRDAASRPLSAAPIWVFGSDGRNRTLESGEQWIQLARMRPEHANTTMSLELPSLTRRQMRLRLTPEGNLEVTPLPSRNQLLVNGRGVNPGDPTLLELGDFVEVHRHLLFVLKRRPLTLQGMEAPTPLARAASQSHPGTAHASREERLKAERLIPCRSYAWIQLMRELDLIEESPGPIFIQGPSGSGKTAVALELHARRPGGPPLTILPCHSLQRSDLESATHGNATVLLEDVADTPLEVQPILRQLLEDSTLDAPSSPGNTERLRLLITSWRTLPRLRTDEELRPDVLSRLQARAVALPPLARAREDILRLGEYFLYLYFLRSPLPNRTWRLPPGVLARKGQPESPDARSPLDEILEPCAQKHLATYAWPDGILQLKSTLEQVARRYQSIAAPLSLQELMDLMEVDVPRPPGQQEPTRLDAVEVIFEQKPLDIEWFEVLMTHSLNCKMAAEARETTEQHAFRRRGELFVIVLNYFDRDEKNALTWCLKQASKPNMKTLLEKYLKKAQQFIESRSA